MERMKLELGCILVILYIMFNYYMEYRRTHQKHKSVLFDMILWLSAFNILMDGVTVWTVNHLETVNHTLNGVLHMFFLLSIDSFFFLVFLYLLSMSVGFPQKKTWRVALYIPYAVNVIFLVVNMPSLEYRQGNISNYSMGLSVYTCFVMAGIYILFSLAIFIRRWNYIESRKRVSIFSCCLVMCCVTAYQMVFPQALISSIGVTLVVLGFYMNQENPAIEELSYYHDEMIMGFATLVENKDGSTGGHIKRTTMYVKLLVEELRRRDYYKQVLTNDYIENLLMAAPMHDIGKISVPDVILQKPGKLTEEEFETMKLHTVSGGKIIQKTFGHLGEQQYAQMAYEVARFHHEKWNGRGYPEGLKGKEIPLCARIMTIADVFDAVSEKRCYRDAMPLEKCFQILQEGSGQDFDPILVEVFLDIREKVEEVHHTINSRLEKESGGIH